MRQSKIFAKSTFYSKYIQSITMPKSRFHGLIKDYDGGTLMECYIHPSIDYTRIPEMLKAQREFILDRIRTISKSDKVIYPPLPKGWTPPSRSGLSSRGNELACRAMSIPGIEEAGWTMADLLASTTSAKDSDRQRNHLKSELLSIVRKVEEQHFSWPFRAPVDTNEVKDYLDVITEPIDLSTMDKRIRKGGWYKSKKQLHSDMVLMVNNCKTYNDVSSPYYECATNLEKYLKVVFPDIS
jgi:histone acetyltransferase